MITIYNCTPHPVTILDKVSREVIKSFPKGELIPRLKQGTHSVDTINSIEITETTFGKVEDLPEVKKDTYYIVSRLVLSVCKDRKDLLVPNEMIRTDDGIVIGCASLARN